jgi:undecaprenyl-diphosphatase
MSIFQIALLAIIQGLAELLPVSSSAHVIAVEKLMGINPSSPQATLLLVMLHTGTMFAVILYFWKAWKKAFFSSNAKTMQFLRAIVLATIVTGAVGYGLKFAIEKVIAHQNQGAKPAEIEDLFNHLELIAAGLAAAGVLILLAGIRAIDRQNVREDITDKDSTVIGAVQGLCLPFRGFSRSGSTISAGLLLGVAKTRLEEYSFALAVVLTPPVVWHEMQRFHKAVQAAGGKAIEPHGVAFSVIGMAFSFLAGLVALKLLSRLLERGKWWIFGVYCLVAAGGVFVMYSYGY